MVIKRKHPPLNPEMVLERKANNEALLMLPFYKIIIFFLCFSFKWLNFIPPREELVKGKGRKFIMLWNWLSDFKRQSKNWALRRRKRKKNVINHVLNPKWLEHINFSPKCADQAESSLNFKLVLLWNYHLILQIKKGKQSIWPKYFIFLFFFRRKSFSTWNGFHFIHCSTF